MKKLVPTQEMIDDLYKMGDKEYSEKWNTYRAVPIRLRKRLNIPPFTKQHGTREHKIENGVEYKWCSKGHWELISEYALCPSRFDGLRCYCKSHEKEVQKKSYYENNPSERIKRWANTESGKLSMRSTWRRQVAKKKAAFVSWSRKDENRIYEIFDGRCAYCGKKVLLSRAEFDHVIPISIGGKTEPKNMVVCCLQCNHGKGGKFDREVIPWLYEKFGESRGDIIYNDVMNRLSQLG